MTEALNDEILALAQTLIREKSVSPDDANCQKVIGNYLEALNFNVEHLQFEDVSNLWATHGEGAPYFVFAGHTDVVPPGPLQDWQTDPFEPTLEAGMLIGRGAADMKGSLAAMLVATKAFLEEQTTSNTGHQGTIAFLITSDEEADAIHGTRRVVETLQSRNVFMDWCLIGEPSSDKTLADTVRTGRRGSLHGQLKVLGIQGHVAYPDDAENPIHRLAPALTELTQTIWDEGNDYFPPTSMQVSNIHAGTGVTNVIPGELEMVFNFRYSTESSQESLETRTEAILKKHGLRFELKWTLSGVPFLTEGGELIPAVQQAVKQYTGLDTLLSTSGGTSDGRFIAPSGTQVVELGPRNATIHKVNECVAVEELFQLRKIYQQILQTLVH